MKLYCLESEGEYIYDVLRQLRNCDNLVEIKKHCDIGTEVLFKIVREFSLTAPIITYIITADRLGNADALIRVLPGLLKSTRTDIIISQCGNNGGYVNVRLMEHASLEELIGRKIRKTQ